MIKAVPTFIYSIPYARPFFPFLAAPNGEGQATDFLCTRNIRYSRKPRWKDKIGQNLHTWCGRLDDKKIKKESPTYGSVRVLIDEKKKEKIFTAQHKQASQIAPVKLTPSKKPVQGIGIGDQNRERVGNFFFNNLSTAAIIQAGRSLRNPLPRSSLPPSPVSTSSLVRLSTE